MHEKALKARELKGEDLHAYMDAKGITHTCPACQHGHVAIMSHGPDQPLHIFVMPCVHPEQAESGTVEMAGLTCANCGHLRMFAAQTIVEWRETAEPRSIRWEEEEPPGDR